MVACSGNMLGFLSIDGGRFTLAWSFSYSKALTFAVVTLLLVDNVPEAHVHERSNDGQGFHDSKVVRDPEHINEHLQGQAAMNVSQMGAEELEFYYFKLHDTDNNTKLDGLEIYKAMVHMLPFDEIENAVYKKVDTRGKTPEQIKKERKEQEIKYYTDIVDNVMKADDIDDDGYLTYPEYIIARRREEAYEEMDHPQKQNSH